MTALASKLGPDFEHTDPRALSQAFHSIIHKTRVRMMEYDAAAQTKENNGTAELVQQFLNGLEANTLRPQTKKFNKFIKNLEEKLQESEDMKQNIEKPWMDFRDYDDKELEMNPIVALEKKMNSKEYREQKFLDVKSNMRGLRAMAEKFL